MRGMKRVVETARARRKEEKKRGTEKEDCTAVEKGNEKREPAPRGKRTKEIEGRGKKLLTHSLT